MRITENRLRRIIRGVVVEQGLKRDNRESEFERIKRDNLLEAESTVEDLLSIMERVNIDVVYSQKFCNSMERKYGQAGVEFCEILKSMMSKGNMSGKNMTFPG